MSKDIIYNTYDLDNIIKKEHGLYFFELVRNIKKTTSGYKFHETCDKLVGKLLITYKDVDGVEEWILALKDTIWIAGTSPSFVLNGLDKCIPFKYSIHSKVVETYLNFYFYFFNKTEVTNDSMKIASWLNDHLTTYEYDKIINRFPQIEKECLFNSLLQYQKIEGTIKKCYVTLEKDMWGDIKWIVKTIEGNQLTWGISSNESYAKSDVLVRCKKLVELHSTCEFIYVNQ